MTDDISSAPELSSAQTASPEIPLTAEVIISPSSQRGILYELEEALSGGNKTSRAINFLVTLIFDLGIGIGGFYGARHLGATHIQAYLIASIGPLLSLIINLYRSRTVSVFSVGILAFQFLGIGLTFFVGKHEKWLLYKDGFLSICISLIFMVSLFIFRPIAFYFFQRFNSDGTRSGIETWERLWRYEHVQKALRKITLIWGVITGIEGVFKIITTAKLSFSDGFLINSTAPMVIIFGGAIATSFVFHKLMQESKKMDIAVGIVFSE